jgi:hypothetical protein
MASLFKDVVMYFVDKKFIKQGELDQNSNSFRFRRTSFKHLTLGKIIIPDQIWFLCEIVGYDKSMVIIKYYFKNSVVENISSGNVLELYKIMNSINCDAVVSRASINPIISRDNMRWHFEVNSTYLGPFNEKQFKLHMKTFEMELAIIWQNFGEKIFSLLTENKVFEEDYLQKKAFWKDWA